MAETTPNIGLQKPLPSEFVDIETLNENMDQIDQAIGIISEVPTTSKNAAGAIAEIYDKLNDRQWESMSLRDGVQIVQGGDVPSILHPTMKGRTFVNLLGRDGNCEDISKVTLTAGSYASLVLDTSNKAYGNNGYKLTYTNTGTTYPVTTGFVFRDLFPLIDKTKCLIVVAEVKNGTGSYVGFQVRYDAVNNSNAKIGTGNITGTTKFTTVYAKFSTDELQTYTKFEVLGHLNLRASGQYGYFDSFRVYQISQEEYDALNAMSSDQIAAKYPYVDDMKHVNAVYMQNPGKNLLPPFSEWTMNSNGVITGEYSYRLTTSSTTNQPSWYKINLINGQEYTYSANHTGRLLVVFYDDKGSILPSEYSTIDETLTFTVPDNTNYTEIRFDGQYSIGSFGISDPMLNIGPEALPFESQKPSYLYLPDCNLRSNVDGSVADRLYTDGQGKPRATRRFREEQADSLDWIFHFEMLGFKAVKFPRPTNLLSYQTTSIIKYDGSYIPSTGNITLGANLFTVDATHFYISIADIDSGWGESYTPTANDIKAFFMGWRYLDRNATSGVAGTKRWVPVGSSVPKTTTSTTSTSTSSIVVASTDSLSIGDLLVVNGFTISITAMSGTTITLSNTVNVSSGDYVHKVTGLTLVGDTNGNYPTTSPSNYTPYRIMYRLAQSVDDLVTYEGSLMLHEGKNQLEVGTGIVVRETANPKYYAVDGSYHINFKDGGSLDSPLKLRASSIKTIYKNGKSDMVWGHRSTGLEYGKDRVFIYSADYDKSAAYSVTYRALDTYTLGIAPEEINADFTPNIRETVESLVREVVEARTESSVLQMTMTQKQQPQWIAPTLLAGWMEFSSMAYPVGYYKDDTGFFRCKGIVRNGTTTNGTVLFYLPSTYRPAQDSQFLVLNYDPAVNFPYSAFVAVLANTGAVVLYNVGTNKALSLESIQFQTAK